MSRYTTMTMGFLLIFLGIKFHMVESYTLTPRATKFYNERIASPVANTNPNPVGTFNNSTGYGPTRYGPGNYNTQYNPQVNYGGQNEFNSWGSFPNSAYGQSTPSPFQNSAYRPPNYQAPTYQAGSNAGNLNTYGASYARPVTGVTGLQQKTVSTPSWLGWPVLFLGAVFVIHGALRRRS